MVRTAPSGWSRMGQKLVRYDKRFAIMKEGRRYNLIDVDTYNEYPASSIKEAKAKAERIAPSSSGHHATKKKSPAQLQREIDEALGYAPGSSVQHYRLSIAGPTGRYVYSEFWGTKDEALDRAQSELKYGASYVNVAVDDRRGGYKTVAEVWPQSHATKKHSTTTFRSHAAKRSLVDVLKGEPYFARVRFEDQLKRASQHRDPNRPRWTAFVQNVLGHDVVGEGATKEAAAKAAVAELPANIRRHFE